MPDTVQHEAFPFTMTPSSGSDWDHTGDALSVVAAPRSDLFVDPGTTGAVNADSNINAHRLLGEAPEGNFQFSARVQADLAAQFDAGVLLLWLDENRWAKLCFELSPDKGA